MSLAKQIGAALDRGMAYFHEMTADLPFDEKVQVYFGVVRRNGSRHGDGIGHALAVRAISVILSLYGEPADVWQLVETILTQEERDRVYARGGQVHRVAFLKWWNTTRIGRRPSEGRVAALDRRMRSIESAIAAKTTAEKIAFYEEMIEHNVKAPGWFGRAVKKRARWALLRLKGLAR
jgi:hypothetical protein